MSPRAAALSRPVAMRLAATEYERCADLFRGLDEAQWHIATECPGWDVRQMAAHMLGMVDMAASVREGRRQAKLAGRAAGRGANYIDALTELQVDEHADWSAARIAARFGERGAKAARARRRTPGLIRRRSMGVAQEINGVDDDWSLGYLIDIILTRDPWMHRTDIARATGVALEITADHDGVLVDDVVREWAARHGRPYELHLTGPAGGTWSSGSGGEQLELDAIEFCRALSGRNGQARVSSLLATDVPF